MVRDGIGRETDSEFSSEKAGLRQKIKDYLVELGPRHWLTRAALRMEALRHGWLLNFRNNKISMRKRNRVLILHEREFVSIPMMFWHHAHYFMTIEPRHENGLDVWDFSTPAMHVYKKSRAAFLVASLPEEDSVEVYTRYYTPQEGDIVWDVGANAGFTTYFLSRLVGPTGRVVAFEPDQENFKTLLANVERHGLSNVTPVQMALDATTGTASFSMENTMTSGIPAYMQYPCNAPIAKVKTLSLPDAANKFGIPNYIKMDIEGAELAVLRASEKWLKATDIKWAIETNHFVNGSFTHESLAPIFQRAGYQIKVELAEGQWHLWASRSQPGT